MTITEVIRFWIEGNGLLNDSVEIYGLPVLWIKRLIKIVQLLSGSLIIIEIIGFSFFNKIGNKLKRVLKKDDIFIFPPALEPLKDKYDDIVSDNNEKSSPKNILNEIYIFIVQAITITIGIVLSICLVYYVSYIDKYMPEYFTLHWLFIIILGIIFFFRIRYISLWFMGILDRIPLFISKYLFLEPIGRFLAQKKLKKSILSISFILLFFSSIIDILLS